jgi:hypothetical protein
VVVWISIRLASPLRIGGGFAQHHAPSRPPLTADTLGGRDKGPRRNFEILSGAGEIDGKISVFATARKAVAGLKRRLGAFVNRLHITSERPIALMTDSAGSFFEARTFLPVKTRFVLDYFHVSMKLSTGMMGCETLCSTRSIYPFNRSWIGFISGCALSAYARLWAYP